MIRKFLAVLPLAVVLGWCVLLGLVVWSTGPDCPAGAVLARPETGPPVCVRINPEPLP